MSVLREHFMISKKYSICFFVVLLLVSACREEDPQPHVTPDAKVNSWIFKSMKDWYLWNDRLPSNPDLTDDPSSFFNALLVDEDRFSWIEEDYQVLINSLQGVTLEAGYEFVLYREGESSNNVNAQIMYVKPSSPASAAGLKRGDLITKINGERLTVSNYRILIGKIRDNHSVHYLPLLTDEEQFGAENSVSLSTVEYVENPNYLSKVIEVDNRRIGYYVYNFFANGTDKQPEEYEKGMDKVFQDFKSAGITDLVVDLRFNSGGSETAARSLASYIGRNIDASKIFARRSYNAQVEKAIKDNPELGSDYLITKFSDKPANVGSLLQDGRIYILTSSRTASASELVINSLKPFMEVFLIGDTTYGKNVGSITLHDDKDTSNRWGLQPIVVKVYNSLNQSDYGNGFAPDVIHKDNNLYIKPLGDPSEALLSMAIGQITGTSTVGRQDASRDGHALIGHSLDFKKNSFRLIMDESLPFAERR